MEGDRIWKNLRRYSAWMFYGCIAGIISCSLYMQGRDFEYEYSVPGITRRQLYDLQAASSRYGAASYIFYPTRLLCIIFAMSTLLRRVSDHASHSYYNTARDHADPLRSSTVQ